MVVVAIEDDYDDDNDARSRRATLVQECVRATRQQQRHSRCQKYEGVPVPKRHQRRVVGVVLAFVASTGSAAAVVVIAVVATAAAAATSHWGGATAMAASSVALAIEIHVGVEISPLKKIALLQCFTSVTSVTTTPSLQ